MCFSSFQQRFGLCLCVTQISSSYFPRTAKYWTGKVCFLLMWFKFKFPHLYLDRKIGSQNLKRTRSSFLLSHHYASIIWPHSVKKKKKKKVVAQMVKHLSAMQETRVRSLGQEDPLEKETSAHSSSLAWKIPWMEEPGRLQFMRLRRVGHDWATSLHLYISCASSISGYGTQKDQECFVFYSWRGYSKWGRQDL